MVLKNIEEIDIKSGRLFPIQFQIFGILLVITGLALLAKNPYISPILIIASLLIFTSYSGLVIDPFRKTYQRYNSILFLKFGPTNRYHAIESIFINSTINGQRIYTAHTAQSATFEHKIYNGYLSLTMDRKST